MSKTKVTVYTKDFAGELEPADKERCQFERNEYHPFTMGGNCHRTVRCDAVPTVIATEVKPMKDGRRGSMSLCDEHRKVLETSAPGHATFKSIKRKK